MPTVVAIQNGKVEECLSQFDLRDGRERQLLRRQATPLPESVSKLTDEQRQAIARNLWRAIAKAR